MSKALLVVNMTNDYLQPGAPAEVPAARRIVEAIAAELEYFHKRDRPVFFCYDCLDPESARFAVHPPHSIRNSRGSCPIDAIKPMPLDYPIATTGYSAFFKTSLADELKQLKVREIFITGVRTELSILSTAFDAVSLGIKVNVPTSCVASSDEIAAAAALQLIRGNLRQLSGEEGSGLLRLGT